jgi:hypothetical protein
MQISDLFSLNYHNVLFLEDEEIPSPQHTQSSSRTKLLPDEDVNNDNRRYKSMSCSACTEDCEVNLYKHTGIVYYILK